MRSIKAMLSSRGAGCTVAELQDEALKAFEDGLLAKEADIRLKLRHNVERIKEVERELVSFRRDMALTSGSKKLALEHLRRRIEAQSERYTEAERRRKEARRAEAEATKERESHEGLVNDFQMLLDQKSKAQTDRMRELTWRLDELSSAADVAGPRGTSTSSRDVTSDGRHLHTGREGGKGGLFSAHGSEQEEKEFHPPQGFSFADEVATGVNKETVDALVDDPHGGGTRSDHATDCGGWEGDVMYEGGSEGVVAWGALSQGEEDRRLRAAKEALGAVTKKAGTGSGSGSVTGSVTVTEGSTQSSRGGGGGGRGGSGRGLGVGGPDGLKIVLTKSGGYSGVAPGPGLGRGWGRRRGLGHKDGGSYGCLTEHSGSAIVPLDDGKKTNVM